MKQRQLVDGSGGGGGGIFISRAWDGLIILLLFLLLALFVTRVMDRFYAKQKPKRKQTTNQIGASSNNLVTVAK